MSIRVCKINTWLLYCSEVTLYRLGVGLLVGVHQTRCVPRGRKVKPHVGHDGLCHRSNGVRGASKLAWESLQRCSDLGVTGIGEDPLFAIAQLLQ